MSGTEFEFGEPRADAPCSKDLKKYFYVIGVVALIILFGSYIYGQSKENGLNITKMIKGLGQSAAVNVPPSPAAPAGAAPVAFPQVNALQAGIMTGQPSVMGGLATVPPVIGHAPIQSGAVIPSGDFAEVARLLHPAVVSVTASAGGPVEANGPMGGMAPDTQLRFATPQARTVENMGSGVIVRQDGYILTNYHVVRGANDVTVSVHELTGGSSRYTADIVKMDEALDLALLKIVPKAPMPYAVLGDSDVVRVADEVIAIGSPFGLELTVSRGIVSAKRKSLVIEGVTHTNLLQTDAAINQGNSGGPLVARNGAVIGINTAIYTPTGAFAGIGFAVPSNQARLFVLDEVGTLPVSTRQGPSMGLVAFPLQGGAAMAPNGLNPQALGAAGPPIVIGTPSPHVDGRQNMDCAMCHDLLPNTGAVGMPGNPALGAQPVALPAQRGAKSGPPIAANAPNPHNDNRATMNCAMCHDILPVPAAAPAAWLGPQMNTVAAPGTLPPPAIVAGTPSPHTDGRQNMDCAMCHKLLPAPAAAAVGWFGPQMNPVAAPGTLPPPAIVAGTPSPHTDGRQNMDCAMCHKLLPAPGAAPVAAPGTGAVQFAQPPTSLAMNVVVPQAPGAFQGGGAGRSLNILGASLQAMSPSVAQRAGQPAGRGVFVVSVAPGSPIGLAGIKAGDVILKVDGRPVLSPGDVSTTLTGMPNGRTVRFGVVHNGQAGNVDVVIGASSVAAAMAAPAPQAFAAPGNVLAAPGNGNVLAAPGMGMQGRGAPGAGAAPRKPLVPTEFAWLGMEIETFQSVQVPAVPAGTMAKGAVVAEVAPGSKAATAGLQMNDVVTEVNNVPVANAAQLDQAIKAANAAGQPILLRINRGGQEFFVAI